MAKDTTEETLTFPRKLFATIRDAAAFLGCDFAVIEDYIKAGRVRVSKHPSHRWPRRIFVEDVVAIQREQQPPVESVPLPNPAALPDDTPGDYPGCGACLRECQVCRQIQTRVCRHMQTDRGWHGPTRFVTDYEAYIILGYNPKGGLIAFLRKHRVPIVSKPNRWDYKIAWDGLIRVKQQLVLQGIDVQEERRGIVAALDQMIALRRQEMAELDAILIQYSVGPEQPLFRYGQVVVQGKPPDGLWYVYHLCYPTGKPFYVGKGIGNRMYQHEKEAMSSPDGNNVYKCRVIRKIKNRGQQVLYRVVFITPDEKEAYEYEVLEIARIGLGRLTNMTPGGLTWEERSRVTGSSVPLEQKNYVQYTRILDARYPPLTQEERQAYTRNWAFCRILKLKRLGQEAWALSHTEAMRKIDAEIDTLNGYAAEQLSFAHLEKWRDRACSPWYRGRLDD